MKYLLIPLASIILSAPVFSATGDPSSLKIKVHRFAVSENADCSNPKIVIDNSANPQYVSMLDSPNFGNGELANGTYPCVMVEMSDQIKFTPEANIGSHCAGGTEYTLDVCGSGTYTNLDGTTGTCTGDNGSAPAANKVEEKLVLYISTNSTSTGGGSNAFEPPTSVGDGSHGFNLGSALIVSGTEVGIFDVDGRGKVDGDNGSNTYCEFSPPIFSFSKR
jgi:hypothetical protein